MITFNGVLPHFSTAAHQTAIEESSMSLLSTTSPLAVSKQLINLLRDPSVDLCLLSN